jgi:hypothetical protein
MSITPGVYSKARAETARLLGYGDDIDGLTPEQATRLDIACALRVLLDNQTGKLLRGESLDARELLMASDALAKILPSLAEPPSEQHLQDPRETLFKIYMQMRERGEVPPEGWHQHRINGLEAEVATLRAQLMGAGLAPALPVVPNSTAITPPLSDIVPPGERAECDHGPSVGLDDPPKRAPVTIEGKAVPPAAGAPAKPAWQDWLDSGGYGGPGFDRWSNRNIP